MSMEGVEMEKQEDSISNLSDSILNSVKKLLGLLPEIKDFDSDILMNINAAIFTLQQIGVGNQKELFLIEDESKTYEDFLGEKSNLIPLVRMYLYYKTKMSFDPPQSGVVENSIKELIQETEWRLIVETENRR